MNKDLISANDLTLADLELYLAKAAVAEAMPRRELAEVLRGYVLAVIFYEPSTRTRLSFEAAMHRLGGGVIGFSDTKSTSVKKGESFLDTVHTVEQYADILVVRHPKEGVARLAGEGASIPILNAGDGANQHPTQTLLDLYTIQKFFGKVSGLKICLAGDLKYSRTVHSLLKALQMFGGVEVVLASPPSLELPFYLKMDNQGNDLDFAETHDLREGIEGADLVYMTRIQRERFPDEVEYAKVKDAFLLDKAMLEGVPDHFRVMHPLPRVNEIATDVDDTPYAGYFEQVRNGMIMREAILSLHLGVEL